MSLLPCGHDAARQFWGRCPICGVTEAAAQLATPDVVEALRLLLDEVTDGDQAYHSGAVDNARTALAALPAAPAGLDVERLAAAMTRVDMGMYWNDEPRQIFDPPNMRRMAFNHAAYARDIAAAYAREEAEA